MQAVRIKQLGSILRHKKQRSSSSHSVFSDFILIQYYLLSPALTKTGKVKTFNTIFIELVQKQNSLQTINGQKPLKPRIQNWWKE